MREYLDSILDFIDSESLTDSEWSEVDVVVEAYSQEVYDELKGVLESRENVSGQLDKLTALFKAKGLDATGAKKTPVSAIFIGSGLC